LALSARAGDGKIADAIYRAKVARPACALYGMSNVKMCDAGEARQVCLSTIRDARARWMAAGCPGNFVDCPATFIARRRPIPPATAIGSETSLFPEMIARPNQPSHLSAPPPSSHLIGWQ